MKNQRTRRSLLLIVVLASLLPGRLALAQTAQESVTQDPEKLRQRYAQITLELAESQLEERLEQNRKIADFYTESELRRYRMNVSVAKRQLAAAHRGGDAVEVHLQHAREQAKVAKADYQKAMNANLKKPNVYTKFQIDQLRLQAELAELRLQIWSQPENNLLSIVDHLHWQLQRLGEEVLELQRRVEKIEIR